MSIPECGILFTALLKQHLWGKVFYLTVTSVCVVQAWQVRSTSPLKNANGTVNASPVCSAPFLWWAAGF